MPVRKSHYYGQNVTFPQKSYETPTPTPLATTEEKIMHMENRPVVAKGEGEGVAGTESLGLIAVNYCLWNG